MAIKVDDIFGGMVLSFCPLFGRKPELTSRIFGGISVFQEQYFPVWIEIKCQTKSVCYEMIIKNTKQNDEKKVLT